MHSPVSGGEKHRRDIPAVAAEYRDGVSEIFIGQFSGIITEMLCTARFTNRDSIVSPVRYTKHISTQIVMHFSCEKLGHFLLVTIPPQWLLTGLILG